MSINIEEVKAIAHLARIDVEQEQLAQYANNLANVLHLAEQMSKVNTDSISPMAHPLNAVQRLREDVVTETDKHAKFQAIAPAVQDRLYLVPKVIE